MTVVGVRLSFRGISVLALLLVLFGFIIAVSGARNLKNPLRDTSGPTYWPGYVAFLMATAFALFLRALFDRVRIETVATVGLVVLLSSAMLILLRLIFGRADARTDT